jgi:hypothetical protein
MLVGSRSRPLVALGGPFGDGVVAVLSLLLPEDTQGSKVTRSVRVDAEIVKPFGWTGSDLVQQAAARFPSVNRHKTAMEVRRGGGGVGGRSRSLFNFPTAQTRRSHQRRPFVSPGPAILIPGAQVTLAAQVCRRGRHSSQACPRRGRRMPDHGP